MRSAGAAAANAPHAQIKPQLSSNPVSPPDVVYKHIKQVALDSETKSHPDCNITGSYLAPVFGQQDEAVVVHQEAVEILSRKKEEEVSVPVCLHEGLMCGDEQADTYNALTAQRTHPFHVRTLRERKKDGGLQTELLYTARQHYVSFWPTRGGPPPGMKDDVSTRSLVHFK